MIPKPARNGSDWTSKFDERQVRLIRNCRDYAAGDPAGVPGHQLMLIVAQMAVLLDSRQQSVTNAEVSWPVPFTSQWSAEASLSESDCGPTAVKMVLTYLFGMNTSVNELTRRMLGANVKQYTHTGHMIPVLRHHGSKVRNHGSYDRQNGPLTIELLNESLRHGRLAIVLVHYDTFNPESSFDGSHWIVVVGCGADYFLVNDPYRRGDDGDHLRISADDLAASMADTVKDKNQANHGLIVWRE